MNTRTAHGDSPRDPGCHRRAVWARRLCGGSWKRFVAGSRELREPDTDRHLLSRRAQAHREQVHTPEAVGPALGALTAEFTAARRRPLPIDALWGLLYAPGEHAARRSKDANSLHMHTGVRPSPRGKGVSGAIGGMHPSAGRLSRLVLEHHAVSQTWEDSLAATPTQLSRMSGGNLSAAEATAAPRRPHSVFVRVSSLRPRDIGESLQRTIDALVGGVPATWR